MGVGRHRVGTGLVPRIYSEGREKWSRGRRPSRGPRPGKGRGSPRGMRLAEEAPGKHVRCTATPLPCGGDGKARGWGAALSPAGQIGRCRPGCGRGLGRPWPPRGTVPRGRSRSGSVSPLPPSPLLPHWGIPGADFAAPPRENREGEGRREDRPTD